MLSNCGAEKTLESPMDCKEIQPVNPKGNQSWILIGRIDAEAEAPISWPHDANSQLTGKDPDAGKEWRQKEKRVTEDEMVGWHYRPNGHELGQTLGDSEGQGGLVCCNPWVYKELEVTEWLNNNNKCLHGYLYLQEFIKLYTMNFFLYSTPECLKNIWF